MLLLIIGVHIASACRRADAPAHRQVVIQLNDTHPTISIPELMRVLLDEGAVPPGDAMLSVIHQLLPHSLSLIRVLDLGGRVGDHSQHLCLHKPHRPAGGSGEVACAADGDRVATVSFHVRVFSCRSAALMPCSGGHMRRHMQIIYEINRRFLLDAESHFGEGDGNADRLSRLSLIEEGDPKWVRMSHLAVVGSFKVNGVSKMHSDILRDSVFADFAAMYPDKFVNVTNGVTPRR